MNKTLTITIAISLIILSNIGQAHFQLLYTPESALNQAQSTEIALVFSHPFHNGYPMSMGTPLEFYVIQDRGESIPTKTTDKPYANWVGGVFRGVVIANGKPVPNAEIEIEYLNHEPLIDQAMFDPNGKIEAPQGSFGTMSIRANDRGEVTIGLPKAGWWGICALDLDDGETYNGKDLSVDAVLWVRAYAP